MLHVLELQIAPQHMVYTDRAASMLLSSSWSLYDTRQVVLKHFSFTLEMQITIQHYFEITHWTVAIQVAISNDIL